MIVLRGGGAIMGVMFQPFPVSYPFLKKATPMSAYCAKPSFSYRLLVHSLFHKSMQKNTHHLCGQCAHSPTNGL